MLTLNSEPVAGRWARICSMTRRANSAPRAKSGGVGLVYTPANRRCWYAVEERALDGGGDRAGIEDVDAGVGAGVEAADDQVRRLPAAVRAGPASRSRPAGPRRPSPAAAASSSRISCTISGVSDRDRMADGALLRRRRHHDDFAQLPQFRTARHAVREHKYRRRWSAESAMCSPLRFIASRNDESQRCYSSSFFRRRM